MNCISLDASCPHVCYMPRPQSFITRVRDARRVVLRRFSRAAYNHIEAQSTRRTIYAELRNCLSSLLESMASRTPLSSKVTSKVSHAMPCSGDCIGLRLYTCYLSLEWEAHPASKTCLGPPVHRQETAQMLARNGKDISHHFPDLFLTRLRSPRRLCSSDADVVRQWAAQTAKFSIGELPSL